MSRTIVLAPFTKNTIADAVLSVELQSHPRSASANRLLVQLHSANNSAESRCKCDVADLISVWLTKIMATINRFIESKASAGLR